ncbi:NAD(P)H-hydrate dehydratase [Siccirubricoccus deserti]
MWPPDERDLGADARAAARHALPEPEGGDKEGRGRVLVVGGSLEVPGGMLLAGTAALRVGAGKLQMATCRSIAPHLALAVPEARVFGVAETPGAASRRQRPRRCATRPGSAARC